jgi:hypothetical protein
MEMAKAHKTFADMEFCAHEQKWEAAANRISYSFVYTRFSRIRVEK